MATKVANSKQTKPIDITLILETIVEDTAKNKDGFTSVTIANRIKKSGHWIRTVEVSAFIKKWHMINYDTYTMSQVEVKRSEDGKSVNACVYHPKNTLASDFNVEEKALTPDEMALLNKPLPLPKLKTTATVSITVDGDGASKQPSNVVQLLSTKKKTLNKKPEPIVDDTVKATDEKPVEKKKAKKQAVTKSSGSRDYTVFNFI